MVLEKFTSLLRTPLSGNHLTTLWRRHFSAAETVAGNFAATWQTIQGIISPWSFYLYQHTLNPRLLLFWRPWIFFSLHGELLRKTFSIHGGFPWDSHAREPSLGNRLPLNLIFTFLKSPPHLYFRNIFSNNMSICEYKYICYMLEHIRNIHI